MGHPTERNQEAAERAVKDIRRKTRKRYSSEEKIRIVLAGLRGEHSVASYSIERNGVRLPLWQAKRGMLDDKRDWSLPTGLGLSDKGNPRDTAYSGLSGTPALSEMPGVRRSSPQARPIKGSAEGFKHRVVGRGAGMRGLCRILSRLG